MNYLYDHMDEYDVVVKIDNDCELTQALTLRSVCELALAGDVLLSPRILGLRRPPAAQGEFVIAGETILDIPQIGGIFLAAPGRIFKTFRYDVNNPSEDDVQLCWWWRGRAGDVGTSSVWRPGTTRRRMDSRPATPPTSSVGCWRASRCDLRQVVLRRTV